MESLNDKAREELKRLFKGNENFINGKPTAQNVNLDTLRKFAFHQEPKACVLSCSDSRVVPEIIFDCGIGELFVVRVAGITAGPNIIESIEYAVKKLEVPLLILLGHDDCGVINYANEHFPKVTDDFKSIMGCVYPVLKEGEKISNDAFTKKHTKWVEDVLMEKSHIVRDAVNEGRLSIAKCHFDHSTGKVYKI